MTGYYATGKGEGGGRGRWAADCSEHVLLHQNIQNADISADMPLVSTMYNGTVAEMSSMVYNLARMQNSQLKHNFAGTIILEHSSACIPVRAFLIVHSFIAARSP